MYLWISIIFLNELTFPASPEWSTYTYHYQYKNKIGAIDKIN